jgi:hypothetical protein
VCGSSVFLNLQLFYYLEVINSILSLRIKINVDWNNKEKMKCIAVMENLEIAS